MVLLLRSKWNGQANECLGRNSCSYSEVEPARATTRSEALLIHHELGRGGLKCACRFGAGEKIDIDPPDTAGSELDEAGAAPLIAARLLAAPGLGDQRFGDDAC